MTKSINFKSLLCSFVPLFALGDGEHLPKEPSALVEQEEKEQDATVLVVGRSHGDAHGQKPEAYSMLEESSNKIKTLRKPKVDEGGRPDDPGSLTHYEVAGRSYYGSGASFEAGNHELIFAAPEDSIEDAPPQEEEGLAHTNVSLRKKQSRRVASRKAEPQRKLSKADEDKESVLDNIFGGNRITARGCFQGSSSFVNAMCQVAGQCCQSDIEGAPACEWPEGQIATVCPFACNGRLACVDVGPGFYADWKSCNGYRACRRIGSTSTKQNSARIGKRSCVGEGACERICDQSPDCQVEVGEESCLGCEACSVIGEYAQDVKIEDSSCATDLLECVSDVYAGGYACRGIAFAAPGSSIQIGSNSCKLGYAPCQGLGRQAAVSVKLGDGVCLGDFACDSIGSKNVEEIQVKDGACTADYACVLLATCGNIEKVKIEEDACTADYSCQYYAYNYDQKEVKIKKNKCTQPSECKGTSSDSCYDY